MTFFTEKDDKIHRQNKVVAVASSEGKIVDQHFATTTAFWVYKLAEDNWSLLGKRENASAQCGCATAEGCGSHTFTRHLEILADCDLVVATRIGAAAAASLLDAGIRGHLSTEPITQVLEKLKSSPKLTHSLKKRSTV